MKHALLVTLCAVVLGCSGSRRTARQAPGHPSIYEQTPRTETVLLEPQTLDATRACRDGFATSWCRVLVERFTFVPGSLEVCADQVDEDDARDCVAHVADRRFSHLGLRTCGQLDQPRQRLACLDAIAERELEAPHLLQCAAQPSSKVVRCLEKTHAYVFNPSDLHDLIGRTIDEAGTSDASTLIPALENNFAERYDLDREEWPETFIFNFAGGATTHIRAMYCSLDEYLLIVGAPINVNGYSGRYPAEVHDFVFTGLMHDFEEFDHASHDYEAGSWAFLPHGTHRVYATETPTYMVEYARGWVPGMLGFGIRHPRHAITQDRKNMKQQIRMCATRALAAQKQLRRGRRKQRKTQRQTKRAVRRALRDAD